MGSITKIIIVKDRNVGTEIGSPLQIFIANINENNEKFKTESWESFNDYVNFILEDYIPGFCEMYNVSTVIDPAELMDCGITAEFAEEFVIR
jgi:hypothetical protein